MLEMRTSNFWTAGIELSSIVRSFFRECGRKLVSDIFDRQTCKKFEEKFKHTFAHIVSKLNFQTL